LIEHFNFTGLKIDQHVQKAVLESGVTEDSPLYKLCPKMCRLLLESKSDNTTKSYFYGFRRWEQFITKQGYPSLPAQPVHVALYLTYLLDQGSTFHPINNALYSIKWAHEINGLTDPTKNSFVSSIQEAAKRTAYKKVVKKEPITVNMLIELCDKFINCIDLLVIRDLTMILIGFAGFLRFDELSSLKFNDVQVKEQFLVLHINKSKTDQYRQGNEILISKGTSVACPVSMYIKYVKLAGFDDCSQQFLFRPIFRSGNICKLIYKNKQLSYTAARENIISRLKLVSGNLNIGLHSLRSGGATAAANSDVDNRCLKRHGRWKTDTSKDGYIVDSVEKRLKISQTLGL